MFRQVNLIDSFSVIDGFIESIYPGQNQQQLVVYSTDTIRIYNLNTSLTLAYQIDLITNIKQIVYQQFSDPQEESESLGRLAILNDLGQLIFLNPSPPFQHKILALNLSTNPIMTTTQHKKALMIRQQDSLYVLFQLQKKELPKMFDIRSITYGNPVQVDCSLDGFLVILSQQYEGPTLKQTQALIHTYLGEYKSTIHQLRLMSLIKPPYDPHKTTYNTLVLQIHALIHDEVFALTSAYLTCHKRNQEAPNPLLKVQFTPHIPINSFMKVVPAQQFIMVCHAPQIQLLKYYSDNSGIQSIMSYQIINSIQGILDLSVGLVENQVFIWMQTELGASFLCSLHEKKPQIQLEIEPEPIKKIKTERVQDVELQFQYYFPTLKKIFDFIRIPNHLFILVGGNYKQQLSKVNQGLQLIQNQETTNFKVNLQNYLQQNQVSQSQFFSTPDGSFLVQMQDIQFFKINKPDEFIMSPINYSIQTSQKLLNVYQFSRYYVLQFENQLIITDLHTNIVLEVRTNKIQSTESFLLIEDENFQFQFCYKVPFTELQPLSKFIPHCPQFQNASISEKDKKIYLMLQNRQTISIFLFRIDEPTEGMKLIFSTDSYLGAPPLIYNINRSVKIQNAHHYSLTCATVQLKPLNEVELNEEMAFIQVLGNTLVLGLVSNSINIYRACLGGASINIFQMVIFNSKIPQVPMPRYPYHRQVSENMLYLEQTGRVIYENYGRLSNYELSPLENDAQLSFINMGKSTFILSMKNDVAVHLLNQIDPLILPHDNLQLNVMALSKQKQMIMLESFTVDSQTFIILASKISKDADSYQNEFIIYRAEQPNQSFVEYREMEMEEIIKLQTLVLPDESVLIVVLSVYVPKACYLRTFRFKPSLKTFVLLDKKEMRDIATDMVPLRVFKKVLISFPESLKYFDCINAKSSNLIHLNLQDSIKPAIQPINILQISAYDHWIAILDNRQRIIVAKFNTEIALEPKIEWIVEFCVNQRQILFEVQLSFLEDKMTLAVIDGMSNIHFYSISQEKHRIKKIADCNVPNACKLRMFQDCFYVSTSSGQVYEFKWESEVGSDYIIQKIMQDSLPFTGGFNPKTKLGVKKQHENQSMPIKGLVLNQSFINLMDYLSIPIRQTIRSKIL